MVAMATTSKERTFKNNKNAGRNVNGKEGSILNTTE
jgi:hypothetical protein